MRQIAGANRRAVVDQQQCVRVKRGLDAGKCRRFELRVPAVERTHAHGEGEIERRLCGRENEVFHRGLAKLEPAACQFRCGPGNCLSNGLRGTIDCDHAAGGELAGNGASRDARTATDLQHPHVRAKRESRDTSGDTRGDALKSHAGKLAKRTERANGIATTRIKKMLRFPSVSCRLYFGTMGHSRDDAAGTAERR